MRGQIAWHSIRQLDADTYQISEPLGAVEPRYGVATVNMYLLLGRARAVLLDSGMGIGDLHALTRTVTKLPLQIVNTHYHWDHSGGNAPLANAPFMRWMLRRWLCSRSWRAWRSKCACRQRRPYYRPALMWTAM
ncbi:hypothetical protein EMGBS3_12330 [Anaerolineaceae bacterium]|nr:hypothetical protein EMGBS3_12330 [Anaerolineaceae bacterium]